MQVCILRISINDFKIKKIFYVFKTPLSINTITNIIYTDYSIQECILKDKNMFKCSLVF